MWNTPVFMPLYFFAHYVLSPASTQASGSLDKPVPGCSYRHLTTATAAVVIVDWMANDAHAHWIIRFLLRRELFPVWVWAGTVFLDHHTARRARQPATIRADEPASTRPDGMLVVRRRVLSLAAASVLAMQWQVWFEEQTLAEMFLPSSVVLERLSLDAVRIALSEGAKWDRVFFALGSMLWFSLSMWDLEVAGMLRRSCFTLAAWSVASFLLGGNGAMFGFMWLYREQVLISSESEGARGS